MAMLTILLLLSAAIVLGEAFDLRAAKAGVVEEQQEAEAAESDRPCPGGWTKYKSRCFMFVNNAMTWPQAENHCLSFQANLASIKDCVENYNLQQLVLRNTGQHQPTWIGGFNSVQNKLWFWSDGSKFDYQSWGQGEPNNYGGNEHCLQMNAGGDKTWNDLNCEVKLPMVCALRTC
ncbi:ladderlectin-like [Salmo salar]|uniref:Ladderlectin-like n=1 Tax=Salmo salar TaxID=8030 RepID=B5XBM3_SALSA|nr:ladderlectin-like [Salmo salar]XP_045544741.1 ladderlectin-like [Salmo salar]XP_045544742.1 ladderlectin-like [Salmo salar]XP_045544743.1 ladderlectin-like [Salmo salar]XP_045567061.1 ladderlectin-like [Salmo salar]XP_045567062.1 ladderlectin-like [Salmo salar]ACI68243.1 Nattectin precursor [Salmo salar]|eukprot:XP_013981236.1 PREDICTED: ladderlectin-like [Salmo salar]